MPITKRISGTATENMTKRVAPNAGFGSIYDAWGGAFGSPSAWGASFHVFLPLSSIGHTARIDKKPTANITKRVTGV